VPWGGSRRCGRWPAKPSLAGSTPARVSDRPGPQGEAPRPCPSC